MIKKEKGLFMTLVYITELLNARRFKFKAVATPMNNKRKCGSKAGDCFTEFGRGAGGIVEICV